MKTGPKSAQKARPSSASKRSPTAAQKLDQLGESEIISRIEDGESQAEIAQSAHVAASALNGWLHANLERSARARSAMEASAEAWLDRGLGVLTDAKDMLEVHRARAIEQHCARRAAIRNPQRYGDRQQIDHNVTSDTAAILMAARKRSGKQDA